MPSWPYIRVFAALASAKKCARTIQLGFFFSAGTKMEDPVPPLFPEAPFIPGKYEVPTGVGESR